MGAAYVNDFVEFGRIYQVKLGARDRAQRIIDDVLKLSVQNVSGEMVPFSAFMRVEEQLGMDQINRYNMYSTASVTCNVAPGSSSGEAIQQMEALFKEQLGDKFGYEWTSVAYQETQAGNTTTIVLVMALIVAFLVLAAQYESWTSPVAAVIGLPVALLGAMIGCMIMGTPVSVYIKQTNEEKNDNGKYNTTFFMRRDYDADAQPNASGAQYNFKIKDADKWTKVVVYYDMGQVVNAISSKKSNANLEVSDTDDDAAILKDCYVAILSLGKGGVVEISDVTLKKK